MLLNFSRVGTGGRILFGSPVARISIVTGRIIATAVISMTMWRSPLLFATPNAKINKPYPEYNHTVYSHCLPLILGVRGSVVRIVELATTVEILALTTASRPSALALACSGTLAVHDVFVRGEYDCEKLRGKKRETASVRKG